VIESNVLPDQFAHFVEILDVFEPHASPETVDDLMLLAREFGYNSLTADLDPPRDVPRNQQSVLDLLQKLDGNVRSIAFQADFRSSRHSSAVI
jgi:hypothetical protein